MATMTRKGFPLGLGGVATVFCVHDRQKRQVTDPEDVKKLGLSLGIVYDARKDIIHNCPCCENLFVTDNDTPTLCHPCLGISVHEVRAPLPEPTGRLN
jgi:hypothetical protein